MTRRRLTLLLLPAALALLLAAAFGWLLHTQPGARWVWQRVAAALPGELQAGSVEGDLQSGLHLAELSYREANLELAADFVTLSLDLDLWPLSLAVHDLSFGELDLSAGSATGDSQAAAPADWLPKLALPLPIEFERVEGRTIRWTGAETGQPFEIRDLVLAATWYRHLAVSRASFGAPASQWQAHFDLGLAAPFSLTLGLDAVAGPFPEAGLERPLDVTAQLDGDLAELRLVLTLQDPDATLSGTLRNLLQTPRWDLQLSARDLAWPPDAAEPGLQAAALAASSYGDPDDYGVELETVVAGADLPATRVQLLASGGREGLQLQVLKLDGESLQAVGEGSVDWRNDSAARITLDVARLDPGRWLPTWGDAAPVHGSVDTEWQAGRLGVRLREFTAPGTLGALNGSGALDAGSGLVEGRLQWQGLAWPPGAQAPAVRSGQGQLELSGRLEQWAIEGEVEIETAEFPPGRLRLSGNGDRESARFLIPHGNVLGGSLSGAGALSWSPDLEWSTALQVDNIDTSLLLPSLPGWLSGQIAAAGAVAPPALDIEISDLSGQLRGRPFAAEGRLALRNGRLVAEQLSLRPGSSELLLDGALSGPDGMAVTAQIISLGDLIEGASGTFGGTGTVSLNPDRPLIRLAGSGHGLAWADNALGRIELQGGAGDGGVLEISVEDGVLGGVHLDSLGVVLDGQQPLERIRARAVSGEDQAELQFRGGVVDWGSPWTSGWQGTLESSRLVAGARGIVVLEEPARLAVGRSGFSLAGACFNGPRSGRLCGDGNWPAVGERKLELTLDDVSPYLVFSLLDSDLSFTQLLNGAFSWRRTPGGRADAHLQLEVSPGEMTADEEVPVLSTGTGHIGFEIADGRLYAGNFEVPIAGGGGIDADFSVPDLSQGLESPLQGHIRLELETIGPLLQLIPGIEGSSGPVMADVGFSGSVDHPRLTGDISLVNGRLEHFGSGLVLEDIRLAGSADRGDVRLDGSFRAGEGSGEIQAVVDLGDPLQPGLEMAVRGSGLALMNVPDLQVQADPDIHLAWRPGNVQFDGRIVVPQARISPRYLPSSDVAESPDFVIVAGQGAAADTGTAEPTEYNINGDLQLELGNDVTVTLDRARARLSGAADFHWRDEILPLAEGGFGVDGEINAYGQSLRVTEGRVSFAGRPVDDPFLNIRAEREIFGNSQVRRAGVLVTGSLQRPLLEPYTEPMTTRERALTLLVTGNDFDYEQGVGSVEVGMYIAPRLFISYGVGLFEDQNVISLRYDLGRGWGIKTTSGQRTTGADISYTIEH